ncbi:MAG TPA: ubiquinol-cytochrome c reductase iron-sulfur subunit, partial [Burkholderiaceae bacterium]|nr:ubiquinol-cytochrome c reductase iron-sulfur subunit [Burkholderiaceae bacterium]
MNTSKTEISEAEAQRRKFLIAGTTGLGMVGVVATAIPFVKSMQPSEAARAAGAPVEVDISAIAPGKLLTVSWRGRPVWVLHRTTEMLRLLDNHDKDLVDPKSIEPQQPPYAQNPTRSIKPNFLVVIGICTHLGCTPGFRPEPGAADLAPDWPGGFFCPCHGSRFDLAGRVY